MSLIGSKTNRVVLLIFPKTQQQFTVFNKTQEFARNSSTRNSNYQAGAVVDRKRLSDGFTFVCGPDSGLNLML